MKTKETINLELEMELHLLQCCRSLLKDLPSGLLSCTEINDEIYYYLKRPTDEKYTPVRKNDKKLIALAMELCKRKWLETLEKTLEQNIISEKQLLKKYRAYDFQSIRERVSKAYRFMGEKKWYSMLGREGFSNKVIQSENPYRREDLIHSTTFGLLVRSKSEVFIAEMLHAAGIPFRYEPEIKLMAPDGMIRSYYPDFVVKHPLGKNLYWEHIGMFDDEDYRKRNEAKYLAYFANHITLGINLIVTCDDVDGAPSIPMFAQIIKWLSDHQPRS